MNRWLLSSLTAGALSLSLLGAAQGAEDGVSPSDAAALSEPMPRARIAADSFYFLMTDRYANGDPSNDGGSPDVAAGLASGGFKPADIGYFHGGDFIGLTENLDRVKQMGFTAVWITPPFVQRAVQGGSAAYHGYWILDFTRIDPHLGTEADFTAFVTKAKALGLKVYLDIVMNHTADVIAYDGSGAFSATTKTNAYIPPDYANAKAPAFLNDLTNYHNQGAISDWNNELQYQNGDFNSLDDIKTENEAVVDGFARVYADWIVKYGIDGFRIDTAKHVDDNFFERWTTKLTQYVRQSKPDFAISTNFDMFGEIYDENATVVARYVRNRALPSALDFPMQKVIVDFASGYGSAKDLADTLAWDDFYNVGSASSRIANAYSLATFDGNHDMGRIGNLLGADQDSTRKIKFATSLIFLTRGAPVVYYGDEVGMIGEGGDKAARQDMFPTQVTAWQTEERVGSAPIGRGSSLTAAALKHPLATYITTLNGLRAKYPALASGAFVLRSSRGNVLAWSKLDGTDRREFVVIANAGKAMKAVVATSTPNAAFKGLLGSSKTFRANAKGLLTVPVASQTTIVLRAASRLPATKLAPRLAVTVERYSGADGILASAKGGKNPLTVTFVARNCPTCAWARLGTDDAAPFRLLLGASAFAGGDYLDVAAISRTSDGKLAAGPATHVTATALGVG